MGAIEVLDKVLSVVALCNLCSPIPKCINMLKTGRTDGWPVLFFAIGLTGACGLVDYGMITGNSTIWQINGIQSFLNLAYIFSYIAVARNKKAPLGMLTAAVVYLAALYSFSFYTLQTANERAVLLGSSSGAVFFMMNSVTVLDVVESFRVKRADYDLLMLSAGMLNNSLWFVYGFLLHDPYLYVPTLPFLLTGCIKVFQLLMYKKPKQAQKKKQ